MRPDEDAEAIATIVLGTVRSPGVVTLSGHDRNQDWDVQPAKGTTGASSQKQGEPIVQFQASFFLAADGSEEPGQDDFTRWEEFQRLIESTTAGDVPFALPIYHPALARNRITEVTNGGIGGMIYDALGGATVQVKFLEFRPPKPKPAAKAEAKPAAPVAQSPGAPPPKPDPNAESKRELAELLETARQP